MKQGVAKHSSEWRIVGKWVLCFWHDEWMWTCVSRLVLYFIFFYLFSPPLFIWIEGLTGGVFPGASVCIVSRLGGIGAQWTPHPRPHLSASKVENRENERWKQYKHSQYFTEHFPAQGHARPDQWFKTELLQLWVNGRSGYFVLLYSYIVIYSDFMVNHHGKKNQRSH